MEHDALLITANLESLDSIFLGQLQPTHNVMVIPYWEIVFYGQLDAAFQAASGHGIT